MTLDNQRANARDELARADAALRAAEALLAAGLHADAVSRAYYGAYHYLRALLHTRALEPRSHAGALRLLNVEFIRRGTLPSSVNRVLAGLQRSRELADYDPSITFAAMDAEAILREAREFAAIVAPLLADFLDAPA